MACVTFFQTFFHCFSVLVFYGFWGAPGPNFRPIFQLVLIKKLVSFPIDFQTSFWSILESQNLPDWALAYTRRSKQKTHVFHFWPHFGCILASKMDAKSSQNASKNLIKIWMNFALKKNRKMDPIWGSRGGPTNQLFTPKIQSGTPWAPQGAPEGVQKVPWTIFARIRIVLTSFFLWFSYPVSNKKWVFSAIGKTTIWLKYSVHHEINQKIWQIFRPSIADHDAASLTSMAPMQSLGLRFGATDFWLQKWMQNPPKMHPKI